MTLHFEGILKGSSSGGGGDTPSASSSLYELKKYPQGLIVDDWCNINSKKELAKATIPTVYADFLEKYQNVDTESTGISTKTNSNPPLFYMGGYYYYTDMTKSGLNRIKNYKIYKSANIDLSDPVLVYETGELTANHSVGPVLVKGDDVIIFIHEDGSLPVFKIFDLDFNLLHSYTQSDNVAEVASQMYRGFFNFYKNKLYFWSKQSPCCYDYINNTLTSFGTYGSSERMYSDLIIFDDYLYFLNNQNTLHRIDVNTGIEENISLSGLDGESSAFFIYAGKLKLINRNKILTIDTEAFTVTAVDTSTVLVGITLGIMSFVKKIDDMYYLCVNKNIYTTTDWETFTLFMENVPVLASSSGSYFYRAFYFSHSGFYFTDDNSVILLSQVTGDMSYIWGGDGGETYYYSGVVKVEYTDDYTIDGNTVTIKYFKSGDWKICVPDTTNDANLETVYTSIGYLPYWRIDVTGEKLTLVRTSKAFTYMYVGDGYKDSTTPTGEWEG